MLQGRRSSSSSLLRTGLGTVVSEKCHGLSCISVFNFTEKTACVVPNMISRLWQKPWNQFCISNSYHLPTYLDYHHHHFILKLRLDDINSPFRIMYHHIFRRPSSSSVSFSLPYTMEEMFFFKMFDNVLKMYFNFLLRLCDHWPYYWFAWFPVSIASLSYHVIPRLD